MLEDLQRENSCEWHDQVEVRKLKLLNEDIEAARKQIESLQKQKSALEEEIEKMNFMRDEIFSNQNDPEESVFSEEEQDIEATFFTLVSQLETEEASLKAEIEAYKNAQTAFSHERSRILQINKKLHKDTRANSQRMETARSQVYDLTSELQILDEQILNKTNQMNELQDTCQALAEESRQRSEYLKRNGENLISELKQIETAKKAELAKNLKEEDSLRHELEKVRKSYDVSVAHLKAKITKQQSISSWMHDRSLLVGKIKRAREQLMQLQQGLKQARREEDKIENKFRVLLGESDTDGTGPLARKIVQAEIDDLAEPRRSAAAVELELEREYKEELTEQEKMLQVSLKDFKDHRKRTISSLEEELRECSQDGYLRLIQEELNKLQTNVSRQ